MEMLTLKLITLINVLEGEEIYQKNNNINTIARKNLNHSKLKYKMKHLLNQTKVITKMNF